MQTDKISVRSGTLILLGGALSILLLKTFLSTTFISLPSAVSDFITMSISVLVEATPFVTLGIIFSIVVRTYIPENWIVKKLPSSPFKRRFILSLLGVFMPVCECGNVPLARGLLISGLRPSETITFLLSAPLLNPITITTTILAFSNDKTIIIGRILGGFIIANIIGWVMATSSNEKNALTAHFSQLCEHSHVPKRSFSRFAQQFKEEANAMMLPLVAGSFVAGATQVIIPRQILSSIGGHIVFGILAMIALAFIVSICASVDAFFALAFVGQFSAGALTAFLVFGPMIDIKLLSLMKTTFTPRILIQMTILVFLLTFILGLVINYAF